VLLCTGSFASQPPGIPFDNQRILDADSVNGLSFLPKSVVVAGSGIIAIEMANIFRKLGSEVTMVVRSNAMQALDRIGLDDTIAERLLRGLSEQGVTVLENTVVDSFECLHEDEDPSALIGGEVACDTIRMALKTKDGQPAGEVEADLYLACLGRKPRAKGTSLELEANGIKLVERSGHIEVDEMFQTTQPGIYAAGDCVVGPALASTGVDQAQRAVEGMFGCAGDTCSTEQTPFPIGVWTIPEVGYYGLTLTQAKAQGYDADVGIATYDMCLRGRVFAPDGMLKLVFDRDSAVILGVHIIGTDACELTHYGMDLVAKKATLFDVISTLFTAVTFHELFKEAALNGNEKLEFGIQWQEVLGELGATMAGVSQGGKHLDEAELKKRFDAIDTSGDGSLDAEELGEVFKSLGTDASPTLVANLVRLADADGNGTIEWDEFLSIFKVLEKMKANQAVDGKAKELVAA
jgi:NAD(P) transhydrogenase